METLIMSRSRVPLRRDPRPAASRQTSLARWMMVVVGVGVITMGRHPANAADQEDTAALPPSVVLEMARIDLANGRVELARERLNLLLQRHAGHAEDRSALAELAAAEQAPT